MTIRGAIRKPTGCDLFDAGPNQHGAALCPIGCVLHGCFFTAGIELDSLNCRRWNRVDVEKTLADIRREHSHVIDIHLRIAATRSSLSSIHRFTAASAYLHPTRAGDGTLRAVAVDAALGALRNSFAVLGIF